MKQFSLDEYLKNPSRKVITRGGRSVRIKCTDAKGGHPVIGLVDRGDYEAPKSFTKDGRLWDNTENNSNDLFFAAEKHEGWITLFRDKNMNLYMSNPFKSEETAIDFGRIQDTFIKTFKIEWEE